MVSGQGFYVSSRSSLVYTTSPSGRRSNDVQAIHTSIFERIVISGFSSRSWQRQELAAAPRRSSNQSVAHATLIRQQPYARHVGIPLGRTNCTRPALIGGFIESAPRPHDRGSLCSVTGRPKLYQRWGKKKRKRDEEKKNTPETFT